MKNSRTIQVSEDNARIFQSAFTKKGVEKKQILNFIDSENIVLDGELAGIEPFSEAGEAMIITENEIIFLAINW